ncbi:alpha/beta hydrolase [Pseudophaeobacter sp.]|uniref:alpha/beta fold hydrolase n=1 Tax=Pseudophaeobacter sp. TaxID=1971739 RepID=UPI00329A4713
MTHLQRIALPSQEQVVAAIYETVLRPELFDQFCPAQQADSRTDGEALPARANPVFEAPILQAHFARALEILELQWTQMGCPDPLTVQAEPPDPMWADSDGKGGGAWLLVDLEGQPLLPQMRQTAGRCRAGAPVSEVQSWLQGPQEVREGWGQFADRIASQRFSWRDILVLETGRPSRKLLCRPVWVGTSGAPVAISIEVLSLIWPEDSSFGCDHLIAETFALDHRECMILRDYMTGVTCNTAPPPELLHIAAKAGAPGVAELIRLVGFLLQERAQDMAISGGRQLPFSFMVCGPAGQETQCFRLGAETGQPVIFVHGMMDGIAGVQRLQPQLRKGGFRVYAPLRGGYGASGPTPGRGQQLEAFVAQIKALIEQENLRRPILLGHRSGAVFARAAALRLRGQIGGVVGVAPAPPIRQPRDYRPLLGNHGWLVPCARLAPALARRILVNWSRSVQQRGASLLVLGQARCGSRAKAQIAEMDLDPLLSSNLTLMMQQRGAGFLADLNLASGVWRDQMIGHAGRTIYMYGSQEELARHSGIYPQVVGAEKVQTRICAGAGNVLLYACPELVLSALEDLSTDQILQTR